MLLLIDFLSLRAREYTFLTRMFQEWEVSWQQAALAREGAERGELVRGAGTLCHRA